MSFIYGNITYAQEHTQSLFNLLNLYQQEYPKPISKVQDYIEEIELDFLSEDLPKLLTSMLVGAERIHQTILGLRTFSSSTISNKNS